MVKKASIAVFTPFYPPIVGGLSNHAAGLNEALQPLGYRCHVLTPDSNKAPAATQEVPEATIYYFPAIELIPNFPIPAFWRLSFWHWWHELRELEVNVVVSRTRFFVTSLMAWRYARSSKVPWIHIEHGADFVQTRQGIVKLLSRWYDLTLGRLVLRQADKVVAVSRKAADFVHDLSGRSDVTAIYRGVTFTPSPKTETPRPSVTLLYLGRLIEGKGIHHLMASLKLLFADQTLPTWHCTIVGSGPSESGLRAEVAQLPPGFPLSLKPEIARSQVSQELSQADIFIHPSLTEGLPTAVVEALLAGCQVVASNVGGTAEITSSPALNLFNPGNTTELKDALSEAIRRAATWQTPRGLTRELERKFSWSTTAEKYDHLFTRLLSKP